MVTEHAGSSITGGIRLVERCGINIERAGEERRKRKKSSELLCPRIMLPCIVNKMKKQYVSQTFCKGSLDLTPDLVPATGQCQCVTMLIIAWGDFGCSKYCCVNGMREELAIVTKIRHGDHKYRGAILSR